MTRTRWLLALAVAACLCPGCEIVSHGDSLPTAAQQADAEFNNRFSDFNQQRR